MASRRVNRSVCNMAVSMTLGDLPNSHGYLSCTYVVVMCYGNFDSGAIMACTSQWCTACHVDLQL